MEQYSAKYKTGQKITIESLFVGNFFGKEEPLCFENLPKGWEWTSIVYRKKKEAISKPELYVVLEHVGQVAEVYLGMDTPKGLILNFNEEEESNCKLDAFERESQVKTVKLEEIKKVYWDLAEELEESRVTLPMFLLTAPISKDYKEFCKRKGLFGPDHEITRAVYRAIEPLFS